MSKLLKLKKWLTIDGTAKHLETVLGEEVTPADVLQLGLDGWLRLSVLFTGDAVYASRCRSVDPASLRFDELALPSGGSIKLPIGQGVFSVGNDNHWFSEEKIVSTLSSDCPWPLAMIGGEVADVKDRHRSLVGIPREPTTSLDGTFVGIKEEGDIWRLKERMDEDDSEPFYPGGVRPPPWVDLDKLKPHSALFFPAGSLPEGIEFVVESVHLIDFIAKLAQRNASPSIDSSSLDEKPLSNRARETLLAIIGILCKEAKLDHTKHSKTAGLIASTAAGMGVSIAETTIEGYLKNVSKALTSRAV